MRISRNCKCWAHLLRKAIKQTLLEPANVEYRQFVDRLLEIYRQACRVQQSEEHVPCGGFTYSPFWCSLNASTLAAAINEIHALKC